MSITRVVMPHVSFPFLCCPLFVVVIIALPMFVVSSLRPIVSVDALVGGLSNVFAGVTIDTESDCKTFKQRRSSIIGVLVSIV